MSNTTTPDWWNMNLSELCTKSLALGVIPMFKFLDKDTVEVSDAEPSLSPTEETPIYLLEKQIRFYEKFIHKIDTKEGLTLTAPDAEEKLQKLKVKLSEKIVEFQSAIGLLEYSQKTQKPS